MQGVWVWSLVGELRSCILCDQKNKKQNKTPKCKTETISQQIDKFNKDFKKGPHFKERRTITEREDEEREGDRNFIWICERERLCACVCVQVCQREINSDHSLQPASPLSSGAELFPSRHFIRCDWLAELQENWMHLWCFLGESNGTPLQYSPGESHGWRSLVGCSPWGRKDSGHDWATSLSLFIFMHWRRKWQTTPVFLPGEPQGWGRTESDTTEVA